MACDPNTLLEQANCIITCIPPGMMGAVNTSLLCQLAGNGGAGGGLFVLRAGDTMTGALNINSGSIAADAPALNITQTWNNVAVDFTALKVNVTDTNSGGNASLMALQTGGLEKFSINKEGRFFHTRQAADNSPIIGELRKRGTTGDVNGAVSANDNLARIDFRGWNGSAYAAGALILATAVDTYSGAQNGTNLLFSCAASGATAATTRATLSATAWNLTNGAAYQLNSVALFNPLSVYASGTVYTLTATSAAVDFGTTDPIITVNAAGTYAIRAKIKVALNAATFAANRTLTVKLRRTNNTATDVANSSTTWIVPIITTLTQTLAVIELPEVLYTTALTNDTIQLFSDISVLPTAGTISIDEASIVAVRLS